MRRAVLGAGVALWIGFVACARVLAPPPPAASPTAETDTLLAGHPLMLAGKAARVLVASGYTTRRFGRDSTWGYASTDRISVRFRYLQRGDSTRVRLQMWGRCDAMVCVRNDLALLLAGLTAEEEAPQ